MPTLDLGGVVLGDIARSPAVIVPLVGPDAASLVVQASAAAGQADLLEWRVDSFEGPLDRACLDSTARRLRDAAGRPLIATVRTHDEGGAFAGSDEGYAELVCRLAGLDAVSLVDVEYARPGAEDCIGWSHRHGTPVLASHHEFARTPPLEEMEAALAMMESMGAQICKLAVMPHDAVDVACLLDATAHRARLARVPLLTMAMGRIGIASRVVGHLFGSCASFASLGELASAPGQPGVTALRRVLTALERLEPAS